MRNSNTNIKGISYRAGSRTFFVSGPRTAGISKKYSFAIKRWGAANAAKGAVLAAAQLWGTPDAIETCDARVQIVLAATVANLLRIK